MDPVLAPLPTPDPDSAPVPVPATRSEIAAWILAALSLFLVLRLHLLAALIGGLAVFELVHMLAPRLPFIRFRRETGRLVAIGLLAMVIVSLLTLATLGIVAFLRSDQGSLAALIAKMADVLESSKAHLPAWVADQIPANVEELKTRGALWLREHAVEVRVVGAEVGRTLVHALIGMVIGAILSLHEARPRGSRAPLARALSERAARLGTAFRRIVFAQVRISALNTALTAIYLAVLLPLLGAPLPLTKTLIATAFLAGLLPVVGNLISNTVIVVVSLSQSVGLAMGSLVFLIVIHKLDYFFNARIVGGEIKAKAWELLIAMLVMETAFGLAGVIAAPIYYAYLKDELSARGLI